MFENGGTDTRGYRNERCRNETTRYARAQNPKTNAYAQTFPRNEMTFIQALKGVEYSTWLKPSVVRPLSQKGLNDG
jgi:hypothetical protein